jgi:hypothetical protein
VRVARHACVLVVVVRQGARAPTERDGTWLTRPDDTLPPGVVGGRRRGWGGGGGRHRMTNAMMMAMFNAQHGSGGNAGNPFGGYSDDDEGDGSGGYSDDDGY